MSLRAERSNSHQQIEVSPKPRRGIASSYQSSQWRLCLPVLIFPCLAGARPGIWGIHPGDSGSHGFGQSSKERRPERLETLQIPPSLACVAGRLGMGS